MKQNKQQAMPQKTMKKRRKNNGKHQIISENYKQNVDCPLTNTGKSQKSTKKTENQAEQ